MAPVCTLDKLRSLARALGDDWDLIEDRVLPGGPPQPTLPDLAELIDRARALAARAAECRTDDDRFLAKLDLLRAWVERASAVDDESEMFAALTAASTLKFGRVGRKENWPDIDGLRTTGQHWRSDVAAIDRRIRRGHVCARWRTGSRSGSTRPQRSGRAEGRLEFHDLLVLARRPAARPTPRSAPRCSGSTGDCCWTSSRTPTRSRSSSPSGSPAARDADGQDWCGRRRPARVAVRRRRPEAVDLPVPAGRHRAPTCRPSSRFGDTVTLTTNFRTVAPVAGLGQRRVRRRSSSAVPDAQPDYRAAGRRSGTSPATGPAVTVLGAEAHPDRPNADAAARTRGRRRRRRRSGRRWPRAGRSTTSGEDAWRPLRLGDIAILVPARTSLPFLEDALDAAGDRLPRPSRARWSTRPARSATCSPPPGRSPTRPTCCPASPRCGRRCSAAATTTCGRWKRAGRLVLHPGAAVRRGDPITPGGSGARLPAPAALRGPVADPERGAGAAHRRPPDARGRGHRPAAAATRGAGCGSSSTRPGPGRRSEHGGLRAYLAWAARQGEDALPGRRGRAAGDRRRRGPGHDHPRREGPRVPDGDPVRA